MRGTAYAIGEIVAFLLLAGMVGVGIGLIIGWGRSRVTNLSPAVDTAAAERANQLQARVGELEAAQQASAGSAARIEALRKELSVAQWQIDAVEEELGKQETPAGTA